MMKGHPDELKSVASQCIPGLNALLLHAVTMSGEPGNTLAISLISLIGSLRALGIEIDSSNVFAKLFVALRTPPRNAQIVNDLPSKGLAAQEGLAGPTDDCDGSTSQALLP
jgi:hypothetical protein